MPDSREFQNNAVSGLSNASPDDLEEAMWRLKVEENDREGLDGKRSSYPDRPGAPDCIYYLRTGLCGYGTNCRYNHPTYNGQGPQERSELPERVGQPDCQYFLKTGTCKFGATCKYHHPRERHNAPVPLNNLGLPMRQDEKACPYYMRTGACKFGTACKFNHPPPATFGTVFPMTGAPAYGSTGPSMVPPSGLPLIGGLSPWPLSRHPYMPSPRMQGLPAYMPVILPPSEGTMPVQQGWNTYTGSVSHLLSTDVTGSTQISNTKFHAQPGPNTTVNLPERPEQPECQYYMKTGNCKYGTSCKYHHPKERRSESPFALGPLGLPLRPGHSVCTFYSMYGSCRFGAACKYDHPLMGYYNYNYAVPVQDPSALFPSNQPQVAWASATETYVPKTLKLPDRFKRSGEMNNNEAKMGSPNNNEQHVDNPPPAQSTSPSSTHTAPCSDSPQNQSD